MLLAAESFDCLAMFNARSLPTPYERARNRVEGYTVS